MSITVIEWVASLSGLLGAALVSSCSRVSGYGFIAYLVSSAAWIAYGAAEGATGLVVMQLGFTVTSVVGIVRAFGLRTRRSRGHPMLNPPASRGTPA